MRKWIFLKSRGYLVIAVLWASLCPSLWADGNDANTISLLHMDGADGSTTFTESASGGTGHAWTAQSAAQIDTAQSVFGGASGLFDGTDDRVTTGDSADWDFGNGNYCVDLRVRPALGGLSFYHVDIQAGDAGGGQGPTMRYLAGRWVMYTQNNVKIDFTGSALLANTWYHVALNRKSQAAGGLQLFVDGTEIANGTDNTNLTGGTAGVTVAAPNNNSANLNGWMDEVRISNTSRFEANFTPQDHAYHTAGGGGGGAAVAATRIKPNKFNAFIERFGLN